MRSEIIRESEDGLHRKVWVLSLHSDYTGCRVIVQSFQDQLRTTKRHRWKTLSGHGVLDDVGRTRKDAYPLPGDVTREALEVFCRTACDAVDRMRGVHAAQYAEVTD